MNVRSRGHSPRRADMTDSVIDSQNTRACPLRFYPTLVKDMLRAGPRSLVKALRYTNQSDIREELRQIQVPTLVIWGEKDRLLPLKDGDRLVSELGDARLETIAGARHIPMVSHPARVARLMVDFFGEDLVRRS